MTPLQGLINGGDDDSEVRRSLLTLGDFMSCFQHGRVRAPALPGIGEIDG